MTGFSLWKGGQKSKDFNFQDRIIREHIKRSGTAFMIHKYIGPHEQNPEDSQLFFPKENINELTIQDVLFGENRDRKYDDTLYEIMGCYQVSESDFDLSQFGLFLSGDMIVVEFHTNELIEVLNRKLMTGDVLEVVHLRDDSTLDASAGVVKKFYVVQDSFRSSYGPTWFSHIWKVKCTPIMDTQEYRDILHKQKEDDFEWFGDFNIAINSDAGVVDSGKKEDDNVQSIHDTLMNRMSVLSDYAKLEVSKRAFEARHLYLRKDSKLSHNKLFEYIFNNEPFPDEYILSGEVFPENPAENDYYIRSDYSPPSLWRRLGGRWRKVSDMWRQEWTPAGRIMESFINNSNVTSVGVHADQTFDERQALSKAVLPKTKEPPRIQPDGSHKFGEPKSTRKSK